MSMEIITDTVPRRSHYWWCTDCNVTGERVERLDFAYNALRVHKAVAHHV